jgi:hypothetical protein
MQPSVGFDWGRVVTPFRWFARIVGGGAYVLWLAASLGHAFGSSLDTVGWLIMGVLGAGLALAVPWKGIGEVVGGLLLVGGGLWVGFKYLPPQTGELAAGAFFFIPGLLFILCGWYALAQRQPRASHATA